MSQHLSQPKQSYEDAHGPMPRGPPVDANGLAQQVVDLGIEGARFDSSPTEGQQPGEEAADPTLTALMEETFGPPGDAPSHDRLQRGLDAIKRTAADGIVALQWLQTAARASPSPGYPLSEQRLCYTCGRPEPKSTCAKCNGPRPRPQASVHHML